jgi:thiamine monophosphate kinase
MSLSPDPMRMALHGGEDYQLLFAVSEKNTPLIPKIQESFAVKEIGRFIPGKDVYWINAAGLRELLVPAGFQHFRKGKS